MAENSKIEWTDHTFNPWIGCTKVSPGCDHCYAETWDARGLQQRESRWGPHASRTRTSPANWRKPLAWNRAAEKAGKRARVFCASLADVFDNHASIKLEWRDDLYKLIEATPHLDWLLLTKRPQNVARFVPGWMTPNSWPANIWLGTTVENQTEADRRTAHLARIPAQVRFLSCEPLLGRITPNLDGIHWVICGGESGPGARVRDGFEDAARSLRDQCGAAGVAFFMKQMAGAHKASMPPIPDDLMVRKFPNATCSAARRIMADKTPCNLTPDEMRRIGAKLMEREG